MGYHGRPSKGCERCRQRKVKCDQRRPSCLRCVKVKSECPGYRNIHDVLFRDESDRVARRTHELHGHIDVPHARSLPNHSTPPSIIALGTLSQPIPDLAANFFFSKYYACDGPSGPGNSHLWLAQKSSELPPCHVLRAVIEAVGMAGISNVHHAPALARKSRQLYGRALAALKESLSDPDEATADTTLMTVNLLGLFEFITFDEWDRSRAWAAHIAGATALLQLRGRKQFDTERGGQMFLQLRSQILYACMQHDVALTPELLQLSLMFDASDMGKRRKESKPGPLGSLVFRLLNLRDSAKANELMDKGATCQAAAEIDCDLVAWGEYLPAYATIGAPAHRSQAADLQWQEHVYGDLAVAQSWSNWRTLRMLANRMILEQDSCTEQGGVTCRVSAGQTIRELSGQICASVRCYIGSPRVVGIIWPLSVVAREPANSMSIRRWAAEQLRSISESMGFRQAGLLAKDISRELETVQDDGEELID